MQQREITIGLLWHSMNSGNLGVGALSIAHIAILREAARGLNAVPRFIVMCWADPDPAYSVDEDIEIAPMRLRDIVRPKGLWAQVRRCDIVFDIGAGDSFADIYGAARISKMLLAQNVVLMAGRKLALGPQTIGPFRRKWVGRLAANLLSRARMVSVRDAQSATCARQIGFNGVLTEATDVALRLPGPALTSSRDPARIRVGINVSGLLFNGGYTGRNMFGLRCDYARVMHKVVQLFHDRSDCEVHLISHVRSEAMPVEDDRRAATTLARSFPNCHLAPDFAGPIEAKAYISGMDFFIGARMHACIAAFSSEIPVVPMAYSRKFAGFFGSLGYPHWIDCCSDTEDEILDRLQRAFEDRDALRRDARKACGEGRRRLDGYGLRAQACLAEILEQPA